jgi:3-oxoacyl-[acyl-carrier protein] reductase
MITLNGKIAFVTGAAQGIGRSIAKELGKAGAEVVVTDINHDEGQKTADQLSTEGIISLFIPLDVTKEEQWESAMAEAKEKLGGIDILVNNAGMDRDNIIMRMKEDEWDSVININLKGCFNGIKAVTRPMMKKKNGRIINITSVIGQIGNAGQCNYAASKAGVIGLTKSLAKELGSRNITINSVAPGYILTDMTSQLDNDVQEKLKTSIPLKRLGKPEDVASLVCFLASDDAAYITGQTFNVDGGMVMI